MAAALLAAPGAAHAEGPHHFDIINHSSNTITITGTVQRCIEDGTSVNWPLMQPRTNLHSQLD
jgi:hypothetical protein